jgi:hypothetical protein
VAASLVLAVLSSEPVATSARPYGEAGENATAVTELPCPAKVVTGTPVAASQMVELFPLLLAAGLQLAAIRVMMPVEHVAVLPFLRAVGRSYPGTPDRRATTPSAQLRLGLGVT